MEKRLFNILAAVALLIGAQSTLQAEANQRFGIETCGTAPLVEGTLEKKGITNVLIPRCNPYLAPLPSENSYLDEISKNPEKTHSETALVSDGLSGVRFLVQTPVRFWETAGLGLYGSADLEEVRKVLEKNARDTGSPLRQPKVFNVDGKEVAGIFIYSANLNGSDVGPVKDFMVLIILEPNETEKSLSKDPVTVLFTWFFYHNGAVNHLWKTQYWGLKQKLANISFSFQQNVKQSVLSLPTKSGDFVEFARMKWNVYATREVEGKKVPRGNIIEYPFPETVQVFVSHSKRVFDPFYFKGTMLYNMDKTSIDPMFPVAGNTMFDEGLGDQFVANKDLEVGKALKQIKFAPRSWQMLTEYSGHLNFPKQPKKHHR